MQLPKPGSELPRHFREAGWLGVAEWASKLYHRKYRTHPGQNIYAHEWDVLVILDAARFDILSSLTDDSIDLPSPTAFDSVGSATPEWMVNTFTKRYSKRMSGTTYVCGNPFSHSKVESTAFDTLDEVWRYAWDDEVGTLLPRPITDRAIHHARSADPERLLVHYMQPHFPSIPAPLGSPIDIESFGEKRPSVWEDLKAGTLTVGTVWESYRRNCELVLDEVELLLSNIDAETVVITSDHGNAFGESLLFGHPSGAAHPVLRKVPWIETSARDEGAHSPDQYETDLTGTVESRLQDLGYKA